jgi:hypothetical protein
LPRNGEISPSRLLDAKKTSVTILSGLQVIPSQVQQSVPFCHDLVRPPSCESPARKCRRELLSCSVQELIGDAKKRMSSMRARPRKLVGNLLLFFVNKKWRVHIFSRNQHGSISIGVSCVQRVYKFRRDWMKKERGVQTGAAAVIIIHLSVLFDFTSHIQQEEKPSQAPAAIGTSLSRFNICYTTPCKLISMCETVRNTRTSHP